MVSSIVLGVSGVLATYVFLRFLLSYTHDPKEPIPVATEIPFISPIIGLAKKTKFYTDLRDKYNLPIYTLRLPGSRIYVVNSTNLIPLVNRQVRVLDFASFEVRAVANITGASPAGKAILHMNRNGVGKHSYAIEFSKAIHPAVTPGPQLDAMNRLSVQKVSEFLDALAATAPRTIRLYEWTRKNIVWATAEGVYGPENPFRDPEIQDAFWRFEPGIVTLLLKLFPSILARESLQAREKVVRAFVKYFGSGGHEKGSALIRARFQHSADYGVSLEDTARFELGGAVAILTNTTPSAFWVLWHVISDAAILAEARAELERLCTVEKDTVTLDITKAKSSCPILFSTLHEVLRFHGMGVSVRQVMEDHLLNGVYLLKKGSTLMIPGPVQHTSKAIYGENIDEFVHKRFVPVPGKRLNATGFRGFGGGSTLCPGRHFASSEIVAFVALMILRFDVKPVSGKWVRPTTAKAGMQAAVPTPDEDIEVEVAQRGGQWAGKKWNILLEVSDKAVEIMADEEGLH